MTREIKILLKELLTEEEYELLVKIVDNRGSLKE